MKRFFEEERRKVRVEKCSECRRGWKKWRRRRKGKKRCWEECGGHKNRKEKSKREWFDG